MSKKPLRPDSETTPSRQLPQVTPDVFGRGSQYDQLQVMQYLIEMQRDIASSSTKLDDLAKKVDRLDEKVSGIGDKITWVRGVLWGAGPLLIVCGILFWWLVGDRINDALKLNRPAMEKNSMPPSGK